MARRARGLTMWTVYPSSPEGGSSLTRGTTTGCCLTWMAWSPTPRRSMPPRGPHYLTTSSAGVPQLRVGTPRRSRTTTIGTSWTASRATTASPTFWHHAVSRCRGADPPTGRRRHGIRAWKPQTASVPQAAHRWCAGVRLHGCPGAAVARLWYRRCCLLIKPELR